MRCKLIPPLLRSSRGASVVEFVLVAPVLLFFIFALIEVARFLTLRGILNTAADQAAALAASNSKIGEWNPDPNALTQSSEYLDGKREVLEKITGDDSLPMTTFFKSNPEADAYIVSAEVRPPEQTSHESKEQTFENRPIIIEVDAVIKPLIPCVGLLLGFTSSNSYCPSSYPLTITATAFKEPTRALTMPVQTDCEGRPFGHPDYYQNCPCDNGKYWDATSRSCVCYTGDRDNDGVCDCESGYELSSDGRSCSCNTAALQCGTGLVADSTSCSCRCDSANGFSTASGQCACDTTTHEVNAAGACVCAQSCNPNQIQGSDCSCSCPDDVYMYAKMSCKAYGGSWDDSQCSCSCPSGMSWERSGGYGYCRCADPTQLLQWDGTAYVCKCAPYDGIEQSADGSCRCTDTNKTLEYGYYCRCNNLGQVCPNSAHSVDSSSCECACVSGTSG